MNSSELISAMGCCDSGSRNCSLNSCALDGCLSLLLESGVWSMRDCARWTSELNIVAEDHDAHVMCCRTAATARNRAIARRADALAQTALQVYGPC